MRRYRKKIVGILSTLLAITITLGLSGTNVLQAEDIEQGPVTMMAVKNDRIIVVDGDTFRIGGERIRLWGIDAPELHQKCFKSTQPVNCGDAAKTFLMGAVLSGEVACETIATDRYKRHVSRCTAGGADIANIMVLSGWAVDYPAYSKGFYRNSEAVAREQHLGLWALKFDAPSDWRKGNRRYK